MELIGCAEPSRPGVDIDISLHGWGKRGRELGWHGPGLRELSDLRLFGIGEAGHCRLAKHDGTGTEKDGENGKTHEAPP